MNGVTAYIVYAMAIGELVVTEGEPEMGLAAGLHEMFYDNVWSVIGSDQATLVSTDCRLYFGATTEGVREVNIVGGVDGDVLPPFVAMAIRQNHPFLSTRKGQKRIPFIPESFSLEGNVSISPENRLLVETYFGKPMSFSENFPFEFDLVGFETQPAIVGVKLGGGTIPPHYVPDDTKLFPIQSAFISKISHQNSRDS